MSRRDLTERASEMKTFDPDDYAASIDRVVELCEEMEEKKSYRAALKAQTALTVMKAIIGNSKFETLPSLTDGLQ